MGDRRAGRVSGRGCRSRSLAGLPGRFGLAASTAPLSPSSRRNNSRKRRGGPVWLTLRLQGIITFFVAATMLMLTAWIAATSQPARPVPRLLPAAHPSRQEQDALLGRRRPQAAHHHLRHPQDWPPVRCRVPLAPARSCRLTRCIGISGEIPDAKDCRGSNDGLANDAPDVLLGTDEAYREPRH